ncbi:hypothetical protein [Dysosmobacter sp.]|uniref:hypothetical protein n=1 Tax=Dysosmobacter sp. TaxID=2591382 RepID=UPI003AB7CD5A
MRQITYTEYQHRKELAPMAEVPIGGDFFGNPYLAKQFAQLQKRYTERLLAGIKAWKEISYQVIGPEKALKYCPEEYDRIEDAAALSKHFVAFMDGQMEKGVRYFQQRPQRRFQGIWRWTRQQKNVG